MADSGFLRAHRGWNEGLLRALGLGDLADDGFARVGRLVPGRCGAAHRRRALLCGGDFRCFDVFAVLKARLQILRKRHNVAHVCGLAAALHVLPTLYGNRSPINDATRR